ncbi:hypothetical protein F443_17228 [Phytophthora nicotianae P1569]|uniref:Uncharacterized protein n=2 Tax=Phytophthora nicotianae TaxID=4792 RepID=V9ECP8_PHYNI|nr:hypothetical protein F443_17228 [Phytophthora nicotianae P1569]ETO65400.1 hypothetical protein F444_17269 [Phytophthora nicotianae P1976]
MVMGKHSDKKIATEEEFFKLEQVLNKTADDTYNCLKLLKKELSDYDSRNGNHSSNTAARFMRTDMRNAKDTAMDLKHVAHDINKNQKPSKTETSSARNIMDSTARAMEALKATARNYDRENKQRMGVKGTIDAAVGGRRGNEMGENRGPHGTDEMRHERGEDRGYFGTNDRERDENRGNFEKNERDRDDDRGFFGSNDFGRGEDRGFYRNTHESDGGVLDRNREEGQPREGFFGGDENEELHRNIPGNKDDNGGRITGSSETVETIVRKVLRDHFSLNALNHQIKAAENSITPSLMERAKEKMHDVKEKIKGDKSDPAYSHHNEGQHKSDAAYSHHNEGQHKSDPAYSHHQEGQHHQQTAMP